MNSAMPNADAVADQNDNDSIGSDADADAGTITDPTFPLLPLLLIILSLRSRAMPMTTHIFIYYTIHRLPPAFRSRQPKSCSQHGESRLTKPPQGKGMRPLPVL